ncbi:fasciclin domain-containing protein [Sphingobacterium bovistauri]|uniref:Fasciclin domain-containing protein n=1 Tax=Sphingobacterium bovistauri TaxID=2781959 RepID=A0ABS7Z516_9SPHI|nr:fasciclin domain-containing protein [Sphingobacterium bovistauri]MCA5003839.1 fasciclin domain-containing protein [Sphingobacterium bovistauri]
MKKILIYVVPILFICLTGCSDKWEAHFGNNDANSQLNLFEIISSSSDYSSFADLLEKSGYAESLKASKNYTVLIPTNEAINAAQTQYNFNDTAVVRSFVGYHIINSIYSVNDNTDTIKAQNFRNKYVEFTRGSFDGIQPKSKNLTASNGLYHVIGQSLQPLNNIYSLVKLEFAGTKQVQAIESFDTAYIENDQTYYKTSPVWVSDVRRNMTTENRKYTYFVIDDAAFDAEFNKLYPYFKTNYEEGNTHRPDSTTTFFAKKFLLRDFIVEGDLLETELSQELTSISGTKFKIPSGSVISRHKASNGVVYRVHSIDVELVNQIKEKIVFGVNPIGYKQTDKRGNTYFRDKRDTIGNLYKDIEIHGHNVTAFYVKYRATAMNVNRYKVYGRAIMGLPGDPQTAVFTQYVHFLNPALVAPNEVDLYKKSVVNHLGSTDTRFTFGVNVLNHNEVYLGEVTQNQYGNLPLLVMSNGTGPIILEYLRFVPIIQ